MNTAYACTMCAREISSTAAHVVTEWATVLCAACAENPASHVVAYRGALSLAHTFADHAVVVGTRLAAHRWQLRLRRAPEVPGG
jgi:hypothetical protein